MLALFTKLRQSTKLSDSRLLLNTNPIPVKRKRGRKQEKKEEEEQKVGRDHPSNSSSSQPSNLSNNKSLQSLGIVSTEKGYQYHPENTSKRRKRKESSPNPPVKQKKKTKGVSSREMKEKELEKTRNSLKKTIPCTFFQRGRCLKKDCPFLHNGTLPLCYNVLKTGTCDVQGCIYNHDPKSTGCMYFHVLHKCKYGENCRFSHDPISEDSLKHLQQIYEEEILQKKSTMSADLAKVMLEENNPSLSAIPKSEKHSSSTPTVKDGEQPKTFENIPSMSVAMNLTNEVDIHSNQDNKENDVQVGIIYNEKDNEIEKPVGQQIDLEDGIEDDLFF